MLFLSQKKYLIAVTNKYYEHQFGKPALKIGASWIVFDEDAGEKEAFDLLYR